MKLKPDAQFLIVTDSFKGTLSAEDAAAAMSEAVLSVLPHAKIKSFPLADGGEGSSALIGKIVGAARIDLEVCGPLGTPVRGFYYRKANDVYIELAAASGFSLVPQKNPDTALRATTFGLGELIRHAIENGADSIMLFLGGSATTDGGVGMAKALGVEFFDRNGDLMRGPGLSQGIYEGERLAKIASISWDNAFIPKCNVKIRAAVDVTNPLTGPLGAAAIFGPQKGADPAMVEVLDRALEQLHATVSTSRANSPLSPSPLLAQTPGFGAAGGSSFGVVAFLGGELVSGTHFFLDTIEFDRHAADAALVLTGEGRADFQSLSGKLLSGLLARAGKTPVISLCGEAALSEEELSRKPNLTLFGLGQPNPKTQPRAALYLLTQQVLRLLTLN